VLCRAHEDPSAGLLRLDRSGILIRPGGEPRAGKPLDFRGVDERPSERLIDQRVRNRVMRALEPLAKGDEGVRLDGNAEYVNQFFDFIDDDAPGDWRAVSTFIPAEVAELDKIQRLLLDAVAATGQICSDDDFIASGWPERIKPIAADALSLMRRRGRFSEDREEERPSNRG
jgi:hypothetical protein